jgi:hypothetical protein
MWRQSEECRTAVCAACLSEERLAETSRTFVELTSRLDQFGDERGWRRFHSLKDLAAGMAIEAAELQELFLWRAGSSSESPARDRGGASEPLPPRNAHTQNVSGFGQIARSAYARISESTIWGGTSARGMRARPRWSAPLRAACLAIWRPFEAFPGTG